MTLDDKLNEIQDGLKNQKLLYLFECFYRPLDKDDPNDQAKLNIALNLFFGNFTELTDVNDLKTTNWIQFFKSSIKEKYETTNKDGTVKFKLKDPAKGLLDNWESYKYLNEAKTKWGYIKESLDNYFDKLTIINKTLIYEAPPYLLSIDESNNLEFEAEFIFDKGCSSPYVNAIKNCFNKQESTEISQILIDNETGFFDVIPIPIPINSDLREKWATEDKFIIDRKRIFVHFFEWALEIYLFKLKGKICPDIHKLAIGIPLKNAVTLYEYAEEEKEWPKQMKTKFCETHQFNATNKKQVGLWVQQYKNCIIGSSNTPSGDLMKLAFGITSS
jgi:hypothetical protein